jgi:hypothetical protein
VWGGGGGTFAETSTVHDCICQKFATSAAYSSNDEGCCEAPRENIHGGIAAGHHSAHPQDIGACLHSHIQPDQHSTCCCSFVSCLCTLNKMTEYTLALFYARLLTCHYSHSTELMERRNQRKRTTLAFAVCAGNCTDLHLVYV